MKVSDFRNAACKHLHTCDFILKHSSERHCSNKKLLYSNVYYLSGFVVECILKYAILKKLHSRESVSDEYLENNKLKDHDLKKLFQKAIQSLPNMTIKKIPDAFKEWKVDIRYQSYGCHNVHLETIDDWMEKFVKPLHKSLIKN